MWSNKKHADLIEQMNIPGNVNIPVINNPEILRNMLRNIKDYSRVKGKLVYTVNFRNEAHRVSDEDDVFIRYASGIEYGRSDEVTKQRYKELAEETRNLLEMEDS